MVQITLLEKKELAVELDSVSQLGFLDKFKDIPEYIRENLNKEFPLREYQIEALARFSYYINEYPKKVKPVHLLFNMATGSGKTLLMAGLILDLYKRGYRNFLFFVNSTNIIEKTKDNFLNNNSSKFLFNDRVIIDNKRINIRKVDNFEGVNNEDINICFTTIQKLHGDLYIEKENSITFEDFKEKKIVFLSDESHHGQTKTKQKTLFGKYDKPNWENTVLGVFSQNEENILLEFTATMDFMNKAIEGKYIDKIIHKYDLKNFRNDKYSKDVEIFRSDTDKKGRILLALILNQYRQDVANKHSIDMKPVILFKAQRTIEQSEENKKFFHEIIEKLSNKDIEEIKKKTDIKEIKKAFEFFEKEGIKTDLLIKKLKINFAENKCMSVNDEKAKEENQILINSLEDKNNQIRAIFAVQKLNEGWDVLNLFDIVRLYEGQASGGQTKGGISPSTISEAQLIGRGARYFPFKTKGLDNDKFKRKFDEDLENELRILEELHFHSWNESRYISELKNALVNEGLIDDKTVEKELKLKEKFIKSFFYKTGAIYLNERIKNDYSYVKSFSDLGFSQKDFKYEVLSFKGKVTQALTDEKYDNLNIKKITKTIKLKEFDKHIIMNAITRKEFFKFENIKNYFPNIDSLNKFIINKEYLTGINIVFEGVKEDIENISNLNKFEAVLSLLNEIENKLKDNFVDYKGSKDFASNKIRYIFPEQPKVLKLEKGSEREKGHEEFIGDKDWYVFNANYGTSEEKACVEFISRLIEEDFNKKYKNIYLIRNELHFRIYNFDDGQAFAPDFVLFMRDENNNDITYQIFIEPKGEHLKEKDQWKEKFLSAISSKYKSKDLIKFIETSKYKIIGIKFYNQKEENDFKEDLLFSLS